MPRSIFQGLARDDSLLYDQYRFADLSPRRGKVLFASDFRRGFEGWRDHYHGNAPANPLSLVDYPLEGGLMVSTQAKPDSSYATGWYGSANSAAFKNLSRHIDGGLCSFSTYITHGFDTGTAALGSFFICIDTQSWDNSRRSFFKLQCGRNDSTGNRSWGIIGGPSNSTYYGIPDTAGNVTSGDNENKYNTDYVRLTVDLTTWKYVEAQINHRVYPLTGLAPNDEAPEPPQVGTPADSFAGGLNCGVVVTPGPAGSGGSWVVFDKPMCTQKEA